MIKVRSVANGIIQSVNPDIKATVYKDTGGSYVNGKWTPSYEITELTIQRQQLNQNDILYLNNLQAQGNYISVYVKGHYDGVNRISKKSADIFVFENREWKVSHVTEQWATWSRLLLCEQALSITA